MTSVTVPISKGTYDALREMASSVGLSVESLLMGKAEDMAEDYHLAKIADEAYSEYLADPSTKQLSELMREEGML